MQNDEWLPLQWRPLRGAVVKRLRGGEQQFNIKKAVIH